MMIQKIDIAMNLSGNMHDNLIEYMKFNIHRKCGHWKYMYIILEINISALDGKDTHCS